MTRATFWMRHYRIVCFALLLIAYLAVLYGLCEFHDLGQASHDAVRVLAPCFELGLATLLCAGFMRLARKVDSAWWLVPAGLIAGLTGLVYPAQIYSLSVSDNFISVLALQNTDSVSFILSPWLIIGALAWLAWWAWFCTSLVTQRRAAPVGAEGWSRPAYAAAFVGIVIVVAWLLVLQGKNHRLEPGYRQAPMVTFATSVYASTFGTDAGAASSTGWIGSTNACFADPGRDAKARYPFQKAYVYRAALPWPAVRSGRPNLIVIFTEGTSARLLGTYGGHYPGLTPNIDRLAARSMQVDDYFNHTAATYRGLIGQLSSGYPLVGGYGKRGWETGNNRLSLRAIRWRTLPMILADHGYQSYFFSPHHTQLPFTAMLDTLGFNRVFTYESIGKGLLDGHYHARAGIDSLDDASMFRGLVAFLRHRHADASNRPFFIGLYNIGTHAFIDVDKHGIRYGNGASPVLNNLHNYDHALGLFLDYFRHSPYADNTILVLTSDHANYPDTAYRKVAGANLKPYFVDRVPLLVDDPFHTLPKHYDANGRNSIALAPTLLQLLGIRKARNSFLGHSLFEPRSFKAGFTAEGWDYFLTTSDGVFGANEIPPSLQRTFACEATVVRRYYKAESENRLTGPSDAPEG